MDMNKNFIYLHMLTVDKKFRGKGIGKLNRGLGLGKAFKAGKDTLFGTIKKIPKIHAYLSLFVMLFFVLIIKLAKK